MSQTTRGLRLVVPDGSMEKVVAGWLEKFGLKVKLVNGRVKTGTTNIPFVESVSYMRPQEIPIYTERGVFDIAIANEDWIANWQSDVVVLYKISVGRATSNPVQIVLAVLEESGYNSVNDLPTGAMVATEYVELASQYFANFGRSDICVTRSFGGTESKIRYGADAVVDVTETGTSLKANGLKIIDTIMTSSVVVAANATACTDPELRSQMDWLVAMIEGSVRSTDYVLLQVNVQAQMVKEAAKLIGGMTSPTKSPLVASDWYELSSYVLKSQYHEVIFQLLNLGARGICVSDNVSIVMGM